MRTDRNSFSEKGISAENKWKMLGALLKKQLRELYSFLTAGTRFKHRAAAIGFGLLMLYAVAACGFSVYVLLYSLARVLIPAGLGWMVFAVGELAAIAASIFGGMFTAKAMIFDANDNELLLSMPIPSGILFTARLSGVVMMNLVFSLVVMLPTLLAYLVSGGNPMSIAAFVPMLLAISFISSVISCLLGGFISLVASKVKHRALVTTLLSFVLLGAYLVLYFKMQSLIVRMLEDPIGIADSVALLKLPGLAGEGEPFALIVTLAVLILLGIVGIIPLIRNFGKIALAPKSSGIASDAAAKFKQRGLYTALLAREYRRLFSCSVYLVNCSLGLFLLPIASVLLVICAEIIRELIGTLGYPPALLVTVAISLVLTMVDLTAPSISLEGKELRIIRSLPISEKAILRSKLLFQLLLTLPLAAICQLTAAYACELSAFDAIFSLAAVLLFAVSTAELGLCANLLLPGLEWTSETAAVKQGPAVAIAIFGGWVLAAVPMVTISLGIGELAAAFAAAFYAVTAIVLLVLLEKPGAKRLAELS